MSKAWQNEWKSPVGTEVKVGRGGELGRRVCTEEKRHKQGKATEGAP